MTRNIQVASPFWEQLLPAESSEEPYPGRYLDDHEANAYFARYFNLYDTEHYHSGVDYLPPQPAHGGLR